MSLRRWSGALALWLGTAAAQEGVARYPGASDVSLAPGLEGAGERFQASYFTTRDTLEQVADFYARLWERAGLPVTVEGDPEEGMVVAAFLTRESRQEAVVLRREQGVTLGFRIERALPGIPEARRPGADAGPGSSSPGEGSLTAAGEPMFLPGTRAQVWAKRVAFWARQGFVPLRGPLAGRSFTWLVRGRQRIALVLAQASPGWVAIVEHRSEEEQP